MISDTDKYPDKLRPLLSNLKGLKNTTLMIVFGVAAVGATFHLLTHFMTLAMINYFALCIGLTLRKARPKLHARWMTFGILSDLAIVLTLQIQRDAVGTATSFTLSPLNQLHILFSTLATLGYIPMLILGYRILKHPQLTHLRRPHRNIGVVTFIFRTLGFFLMFSMLKNS